METLQTAIESFINRYPEVNSLGRPIDIKELEKMNPELREKMPEWFMQMITTYPLFGIEIGIAHDYGQEELKGKPTDELPLLGIAFNSFEDIEEAVTDLHPGLDLIHANYIPIAEERNGDGEGIYVDTTQADPAPLLIYHDGGYTTEELIESAESLATSFSHFFQEAKILNRDRIPAAAVIPELQSIVKDLLAAMESKLQVIDDSEKVAFIIRSCRTFYDEGKYVQALERIESNLYDNSIKIEPEFYNKVEKCYDLANLHKGELCYFKELVK